MTSASQHCVLRQKRIFSQIRLCLLPELSLKAVEVNLLTSHHQSDLQQYLPYGQDSARTSCRLTIRSEAVSSSVAPNTPGTSAWRTAGPSCASSSSRSAAHRLRAHLDGHCSWLDCVLHKARGKVQIMSGKATALEQNNHSAAAAQDHVTPQAAAEPLPWRYRSFEKRALQVALRSMPALVIPLTSSMTLP